MRLCIFIYKALEYRFLNFYKIKFLKIFYNFFPKFYVFVHIF